jgi:hypothetical protein
MTSIRLEPFRIPAALLLMGAAACDGDAVRTLEPSAPSLVRASASATKTQVIPPKAHPHGRSYGEWGAAWWQYVLSVPVAENPLLDETGANCGVGQSGHVFFLVGSLSGTAVRSECVVPTGAMLFFPVVNTIFAAAETPPPIEELVSGAAEAIETATDLAVEIDGNPVEGLQRFRAPSSGFGFTLPEDNLFGAPAGSCVPDPTVGACIPWVAAQDGFYLMLPPLPPGEHTLHIHAVLPAFGFTLDVTYDPLTVVPRNRLAHRAGVGSASTQGNKGESLKRATPGSSRLIQKRGSMYVGVG